MIGVFVRDDDAGEGFGILPDVAQALESLPAAESGVHEDARPVGADERAVTRA